MKKLTIKDFGPLRNAELDLEQLNLIIGMQGSGKSCVLRTACYCSWVQKRIFLANSADEFTRPGAFVNLLVDYYQMRDFLKPTTYICYETNYLSFAYSHSTGLFEHKLNNRNKSKYCRPKVSYVPAERNLVTTVSNWNKIAIGNDCLLEFMADWDAARHCSKSSYELLNLGVSYTYDSSNNQDYLTTKSGKNIALKSGSSGLQSLTPVIVILDYICRDIFDEEKNNRKISFKDKQLSRSLIASLYKKKKKEFRNGTVVRILEGEQYAFSSAYNADTFQAHINRLLNTDHAEMFIEEPEDNLFPPTQNQLVDKLLDTLRDKQNNNTLFIATHSPYVLNRIIESGFKQLHFFFTYPVGEGLYDVKELTDDEMKLILDNSVDMFFNFEAFLD